MKKGNGITHCIDFEGFSNHINFNDELFINVQDKDLLMSEMGLPIDNVCNYEFEKSQLIWHTKRRILRIYAQLCELEMQIEVEALRDKYEKKMERAKENFNAVSKLAKQALQV